MRNIFLILFFFIVACQTPRKSSSLSFQQIEYIRDYFFCRCLEHAYSEELTNKIKQNDISQSVLFDVGNLGKYYQIIDSLAMQKAKSIQSTQILDYRNKKPVIMKCLEYGRNINVKNILKNRTYH